MNTKNRIAPTVCPRPRVASPRCGMKLMFALFLGLAMLGAAQPGPALADGHTTRLRVLEPRPLKVMTQNLYIGASIFRIFDAETPGDVPVVVAQIFQTVLATDFPQRAAALAEQIEREQPDIIGLQEAVLFRIQSPGDFLIGNPQPATDVLMDYLEILLHALAERDLHYEVAAQNENADVELPMFAGFNEDGSPKFSDIRITDRDVILKRSGIATANELAQTFENNLAVTVAGVDIEFTRGFLAVDATVNDRTYRIVNTHLEPVDAGPGPLIRGSQAREIIFQMSEEALPVVLLGDINSSPADAPSDAYFLFGNAGYVDLWTRRRGRPAEGFTCCRDETLTDVNAYLHERIDVIFVRNNLSVLPTSLVGAPSVVLSGDDPADMTPSGLWPSDHAGVTAAMEIPILTLE